MNEIIFSYTTKQAVEDGVLFKVDSGILKEIGIKYPVYLTDYVFRRYVQVPADAKDHQDLDARLFDLLFMYRRSATQCYSALMYFYFTCLLRQDAKAQANERKSELSDFHKEVRLKSLITAQDINDPSPAIFIMLPWED